MKTKSKIIPNKSGQNSKLRKFKICNLQFTILNSQEGMVLIVSLLLLLVATVVGITALSTSTTKVMIAGNQRLSEINFSNADGGVSVSLPIIKTTWDDRNFGTSTSTVYAGLITDPNFLDEPAQDADINDIQYLDLAVTTTISIDIDRLYEDQPPGCGMKFATGGEGSGSFCVDKYYRVNSNSAGPVGSVAGVGALYRYVLR